LKSPPIAPGEMGKTEQALASKWEKRANSIVVTLDRLGKKRKEHRDETFVEKKTSRSFQGEKGRRDLGPKAVTPCPTGEKGKQTFKKKKKGVYLESWQ